MADCVLHLGSSVRDGLFAFQCVCARRGAGVEHSGGVGVSIQRE